MKTLIARILCSILFLMSCTQEVSQINDFETLKAAKVNIPATIDLTVVPDSNSPQITCLPVETGILLPEKYGLKGTVDYLDELDEQKSFVENISCEFIEPSFIQEEVKGTMSSKNGDSFNFTGTVKMDISSALTSKTVIVEGQLKLISGTGKFAGVSGSIKTNGTGNIANGAITWKGDGYYAYK